MDEIFEINFFDEQEDQEIIYEYCKDKLIEYNRLYKDIPSMISAACVYILKMCYKYSITNNDLYVKIPIYIYQTLYSILGDKAYITEYFFYPNDYELSFFDEEDGDEAIRLESIIISLLLSITPYRREGISEVIGARLKYVGDKYRNIIFDEIKRIIEMNQDMIEEMEKLI